MSKHNENKESKKDHNCPLKIYFVQQVEDIWTKTSNYGFRFTMSHEWWSAHTRSTLKDRMQVCKWQGNWNNAICFPQKYVDYFHKKRNGEESAKQTKIHIWHTHTHTHTFHGSPVSAISYSLVDRLTPIALSLTPGHAWHSSVASGTSGNWAFFVITCACRSCSILWQFQSHAVAKPGFLTAWMLVCLLVQSLLF